MERPNAPLVGETSPRWCFDDAKRDQGTGQKEVDECVPPLSEPDTIPRNVYYAERKGSGAAVSRRLNPLVGGSVSQRRKDNMTREEREVWEGLDDDERLDAYRDALDNLRDMEGCYKVVRAQLNAMIRDAANSPICFNTQAEDGGKEGKR